MGPIRTTAKPTTPLPAVAPRTPLESLPDATANARPPVRITRQTAMSPITISFTMRTSCRWSPELIGKPFIAEGI